MAAIDEFPLTVNVPLWGRVAYGIGRDASYAAARSKVFPVIEIGGVKRVPVRVALKPLVEEGADLTAILARFRKAERAKDAG